MLRWSSVGGNEQNGCGGFGASSATAWLSSESTASARRREHGGARVSVARVGEKEHGAPTIYGGGLPYLVREADTGSGAKIGAESIGTRPRIGFGTNGETSVGVGYGRDSGKTKAGRSWAGAGRLGHRAAARAGERGGRWAAREWELGRLAGFRPERV